MTSVQVSQPPALQQQQTQTQQQQQQQQQHLTHFFNQMQRGSVSPISMQQDYQIEHNDKNINNNNINNNNNSNNNNNNQSRCTTVSPHSVQSTQTSPSNSQPNSPFNSSPAAHTNEAQQQQHLMPVPPPPTLMATSANLPLSLPPTVGAQRLYDTFPLNGYSISRLPPLATAILTQSQPASPTHATALAQPAILPPTSVATTLPQSQPKKSAFCIDSLLAKNQTAANDAETAQTAPIRTVNTFFPMPADDRLAALQCMAAQQHAGSGLDMSQQTALSLGRMSEQEALQRIRDSRVYGTPSPDGMSR